MIHSLAGGSLQQLKVQDFVKVEILQGVNIGGIYWYLSCGNENVGDTVIVPIGKYNERVRARVIRIDKNISAQVAPVPLKIAKRVIQVVK